MQFPKALLELPASTLQVPAADSTTPRWELDAALAVLARAREEWAALAHTDANQQTRQAVQRRLQSAQQLVARINGKLEEPESTWPPEQPGSMPEDPEQDQGERQLRMRS
jgi:uncharacterized protein with beta-barrel porin domain